MNKKASGKGKKKEEKRKAKDSTEKETDPMCLMSVFALDPAETERQRETRTDRPRNGRKAGQNNNGQKQKGKLHLIGRNATASKASIYPNPLRGFGWFKVLSTPTP